MVSPFFSFSSFIPSFYHFNYPRICVVVVVVVLLVVVTSAPSDDALLLSSPIGTGAKTGMMVALRLSRPK